MHYVNSYIHQITITFLCALETPFFKAKCGLRLCYRFIHSPQGILFARLSNNFYCNSDLLSIN